VTNEDKEIEGVSNFVFFNFVGEGENNIQIESITRGVNNYAT
jgi:hypothetical protein